MFLDLGSGMGCPKTLFRRRHFQVSGATLNPSSSSSHIRILLSNYIWHCSGSCSDIYHLGHSKITELNWTQFLLFLDIFWFFDFGFCCCCCCCYCYCRAAVLRSVTYIAWRCLYFAVYISLSLSIFDCCQISMYLVAASTWHWSRAVQTSLQERDSWSEEEMLVWVPFVGLFLLFTPSVSKSNMINAGLTSSWSSPTVQKSLKCSEMSSDTLTWIVLWTKTQLGNRSFTVAQSVVHRYGRCYQIFVTFDGFRCCV